MKKLLTYLTLTVLLGCTCFSQIPDQIEYLGEDCEVIVKDYRDLVVVSDNCGVQSIVQIPTPGNTVSQSFVATITALDVNGLQADISFNVHLIDTIPPSITVLPSQTAYADSTVIDMYYIFREWVETYPILLDTVLKWDKFQHEALDGTLYYDDIAMLDGVCLRNAMLIK